MCHYILLCLPNYLSRRAEAQVVVARAEEKVDGVLQKMVSQYNSAVAMFTRTGSAHGHHYHGSPATNPYFTPTYGGYPHHYHPQGSTPNPSVSLTSTQFSPNMSPDFNSNNHYPHEVGHMTSSDQTAAMAAAASTWNHRYSACHRNIASGYNEWSHQRGHHALHNPTSFYSHLQPSPSSSTPSPNSSIHHQSHHALPISNNNHSSSTGTTSAPPSIGLTPSPDSGMTISDEVSSSGSPVTSVAVSGQAEQEQDFVGGVSAHHLASSLNGLIGSQQNNNLNHQQEQERPGQARSLFEWMKKHPYESSNNGTINKS